MVWSGGLAARALLVGSCAMVAALAAQPATVLDHQAQLERWSWWDNRDWDWYRRTIPFFESPDDEIDQTYYYRWELVTRHLVYTSPTDGYTISAFIDRSGRDGPGGADSAALGRQLNEVRWAKDRRVAEDFARSWSAPAGGSRGSSNWYAHAVWSFYQVSGDREFLRRMAPAMVQQYQGWLAERWDAGAGLFRCSGSDDGMQGNINSRQTDDPFAGGPGYRPTLNSYLYGDLVALGGTMETLGDATAAAGFRQQAAALRSRVQAELWDPARGFFFHRSAQEESSEVTVDGERRSFVVPAGTLTHGAGRFAGSPRGRELIGYLPWQFHLPEPGRGAESAWRGVTDPEVFFGDYGLTSVERHDPLFLIARDCCVWSGTSWPALTSQVLTAMANVLNDYPQQVVGKADYLAVLQAYTRGQRKNGRPYVAEAVHPDTGSWSGHDASNHSEHHFDSTYIDLIISGLVGLRPRADDQLEVNPLAPDHWPWWCLDDVDYHGHRISILWDRDGSRYGRGAGLVVLADGVVLARRAGPGRILVQLPAPQRETAAAPPRYNLAVNHGDAHYPRVTASHSCETTPVQRLQDGVAWYERSPPNRWTTRGSSAPRDWVALDLGTERGIDRVSLHLLDDGPGEEIRVPLAYDLLYWDGAEWRSVPGQRRTPSEPSGRRANVVDFPTLGTRHLRVELTHRAGACSGLSELEAWSSGGVPPPPPPQSFENAALADAQRGLPLVTASLISRFDQLGDVNDGTTPLDGDSRNRWTTWRSPNRLDWVAFDFGGDRQVGRVEVHLWGDHLRIAAPRRFTVERWDGRGWEAMPQAHHRPSRPVVHAPNTVTFPPRICRRLRLVFEHALPSFTGVGEIGIWDE
jgi:hypothetical protein